MAKTVIPANIARVAIIETTVFGAVAHRAQCMVPGCTDRSATLDPRADGDPHGAVIRWAKTHGQKHADAADAAEAWERTS